VERRIPKIEQQVKSDTVRPSLRQQVDFCADVQAFAKPCEGLFHERAITSLEGEQEHCEGAEEVVREREVDAVEHEGRCAVRCLASCLGLISLRLADFVSFLAEYCSRYWIADFRDLGPRPNPPE
jgi:hypothetical protein